MARFAGLCVAEGGPERAGRLLQQLVVACQARRRSQSAVHRDHALTRTRLPAVQQPPFPGSQEMERRIKSLVRWNALAMVVRANKMQEGIGGHISTFASAATLYEVAFNHFLRAQTETGDRDIVYFQGHAAPGMYARAYLEGRIPRQKLENFRRELKAGGGLSSYPHPWLMPDFWEFPTVSMGLGPIQAIYQARFIRYLENRGLKQSDRRQGLGLPRRRRNGRTRVAGLHHPGLARAARQPDLRGELQPAAAGWPGARQRQDHSGTGSHLPRRRMERDQSHLGQRLGQPHPQRSRWPAGQAHGRDHRRPVPEILRRERRLLPAQLLRHRSAFAQDGGASFRRAAVLACGWADTIPSKFTPLSKLPSSTADHRRIILAKTIKGYGLGEAGEGKNITHQQKKLNDEELSMFRSRFGIPIPDDELHNAPFYRPPDDSPEISYMQERRKQLGGYLPERKVRSKPINPVSESHFEEFYKGTDGREVSTTMVFVRLLSKLLRDPEIGKLIVPIIPDEARTFGMEALFRQVGIYSSVGQLYEPVDMDTLLYYKEAKDGQILEEGITEAGSMCSFIAAGTAYANHGINTIPFFIYYSMFGFQRIGDLIWAAADMRTRGFLIGGTAGRTTLAGEGLQHQDGHSHVLALSVPNLLAYDPAFAYEIAVIIQDGIKRMYVDQESIFYYLTVTNEPLPMPEMPKGAEIRDGILKGLYRFKASDKKGCQAARPTLRQRNHHVRSAEGAADSGRKIRSRCRRLERDQLQAALSRWQRLRSLEHAASGRDAARPVRYSVPEGCTGRVRGGIGLYEGASGIDRAVGAASAGRSGH